MQPPLDRPHPALLHREARRFRLRPLALGGVLAAGAAPLFLGLAGIAALSDEGPHEALEVVLLLLLLRFSLLPLAFSLLGSNLATKCARPIAGLGLLAKPDWRQSSFCSMLLSPWRRSRRPRDDVSRGDGPEWPSTPCRLDRRMGADRAPVRLARAEGLRAHPPDGAVRWPGLRARRRRRARPLSARCSAGWRASRQRGWRVFSAPSTPGARGCRIP